MALDSNDKHKNSTAQKSENADKSKTMRHCRWTRDETLVLIEGKKIAEERGRKGRRSDSGFGLDLVEPKWDLVSSYCNERGVNRGPVQCRKRWSNLIGDFRKIQTWEELYVKDESESFWTMRNDLKRERKLPGFFDKEVYDVLSGKELATVGYKLAFVTERARPKDEEKIVAEENEGEKEEEDEEGEAIFDSGRQAAAAEALFFESEQPVQEKSPDKERNTIHSPVPISGSFSQEGCKRRRTSTDTCRDVNLESRLINVLEKNANMLNSQLEAHNTYLQSDRDQQKNQNESLIDALKKVTEALTRISDKLTKDN